MNEQNGQVTAAQTPEETVKRNKRKRKILISAILACVVLLFAPILAAVCIYFHFNPPGHTYVYKGGKYASSATYAQYTKLVIKDGVKTIPDHLFSCGFFEEGIVFPDCLVRIGTDSFYGCNMTELAIPDSVTEIGEYAFSTCRELRSVKLSSNLSEIAPGTFDSCYELAEITIPNGVSKIGKDAFSHCGKLPAVAIPTSVRELGSYAFFCCVELNELTLSEGLTVIGDHAFSGCTSLQSVIIPDGVETVEDYAFRNTRLTSVSLPAGITSLGYRAFGDCPTLSEITYRGTKDQWNAIDKNAGCFGGSSVATVHCSDGDIILE